jgi:hypothetical protein
MAQWWICPADGQVVIDDASIVDLDTSSIPADVRLVFWHETYGEILRNQSTTLSVREKFSDVSPYVPIFDKWIVASEHETPPATLAQAKAVKTRIVNDLYNSKIHAPISTSVGVHDASAEAQDAMLTDITAGTSAGGASAVGSLADRIDQLTASVNAAIDAWNTAWANLKGNVYDYDWTIINGTYIALINQAIQTITVNKDTGVYLGHTPMPYQALPVGDLILIPHVSSGGTGGPAPPMWQQTVMSAIGTRTNQLKAVRNSHISNIYAQSTIAAVAAYNILAGW